MKPWNVLLLTIAGLILLSIVVVWTNLPAEAQTATAGERIPVIVELFTSEGCSSCPPADAVLSELEKSQPVANAQIITLGEHVDYWNYLGWSDPFSNAIFSQRQQAYSQSLGSNTYTPQMVVNGRAEFNGGDAHKAAATITRAIREPRAKLTLTSGANAKIAVTTTAIPAGVDVTNLQVVLALTENNLSSNVVRGENAGRVLKHRTVVRSLKVIGTPAKAEANLTFDKNWKRENLQIVAFLQDSKNHRIYGATVMAAPLT